MLHLAEFVLHLQLISEGFPLTSGRLQLVHKMAPGTLASFVFRSVLVVFPFPPLPSG